MDEGFDFFFAGSPRHQTTCCTCGTSCTKMLRVFASPRVLLTQPMVLQYTYSGSRRMFWYLRSIQQDLEAHFKAKGKKVTHETIEEFAWETLNSGKVRSLRRFRLV